jgi:hypothetical protein
LATAYSRSLARVAVNRVSATTARAMRKPVGPYQVELDPGGVGQHQGAAGDLDGVRVAAQPDRVGPPTWGRPAQSDLARQGHHRPATGKGGQVVGRPGMTTVRATARRATLTRLTERPSSAAIPCHGRLPGGGRRRCGRNPRGGGATSGRCRRAAGTLAGRSPPPEQPPRAARPRVRTTTHFRTHPIVSHVASRRAGVGAVGRDLPGRSWWWRSVQPLRPAQRRARRRRCRAALTGG